jgi:hypothetical protein
MPALVGEGLSQQSRSPSPSVSVRSGVPSALRHSGPPATGGAPPQVPRVTSTATRLSSKAPFVQSTSLCWAPKVIGSHSRSEVQNGWGEVNRSSTAPVFLFTRKIFAGMGVGGISSRRIAGGGGLHPMYRFSPATETPLAAPTVPSPSAVGLQSTGTARSDPTEFPASSKR